jgi:hypothetical protein
LSAPDPNGERAWSTELFKAVEEAWKGKLMYTNYAPASKAVYDQVGGLHPVFMVSPGKEVLHAVSPC